MTGSYKAKPLSRKIIQNCVRKLKKSLDMESRFMFPVIEFLEFILPTCIADFELEVAPVEAMPNKEGETYPNQNKIIIREDIYEKACAMDGRARFTVAHEIGHLLLHEQSAIALCRMEAGQRLKSYEDPEWQANEFAAELLAPTYLIKGMSAEDVHRRCGVSLSAAKVQLSKIY